jgi:hypothetical protein
LDQVLDFLYTLIVGLLGIIMAAVATVETFLRDAMTQAGVGAQAQGVVLIAAAVLLILAAYRLFGGILGILITVFLLLLVAHVLVPGLDFQAPVQHT